ncbi:MAG: substrate-binding domain-containing protein, partial [Methylococcaceae bacterium]
KETEAINATATGNPDVHLKPNASITVMFHGNRFAVAEEIVNAYEKKYGTTVSYTSLPPGVTVRVLAKYLKSAHPPIQGDKWSPSQATIDLINPDVVMLNPGILGLDKTRLGNELSGMVSPLGLYSTVHDVVMVNRASDKRVTSFEAAFEGKSLRFVMPGKNSNLPIWKILENKLGKEKFDAIKNSGRMGLSHPKHHRFVPLRIAASCEDFGFQYWQSAPSLERDYPGQLKFTKLNLARTDLVAEDSAVYVVKQTKNESEAKRFAEFMLSADAQTILKKYHLEI